MSLIYFYDLLNQNGGPKRLNVNEKGLPRVPTCQRRMPANVIEIKKLVKNSVASAIC